MNLRVFHINSLFISKAITICVIALALLGCDKKNQSIPVSKTPLLGHVYFKDQKLFQVNVQNTLNSKILTTLQTQEDGSFVLDISDDINKSTLLYISTQEPFLSTYATLEDIKKTGINLSVVTTFATYDIDINQTHSTILKEYNLRAKKLLRLSLDNQQDINYQDLNSYKPSLKKNSAFINPYLVKQLLETVFGDKLTTQTSLNSIMKQDIDSDTLSTYTELLLGTNPSNEDSDSDGINDKQEVDLKLNPLSRDSDFDGLNDYDEYTGLTDPHLSDSDGDYFSDSYELLIGSDPLNADEDANGILDGLDGDPLFKYQWHLQSNGDVVSNTHNEATIKGNDLDILQVYSLQRGTDKTIVQVVDTGVELKHEDLHVSQKYSYNSKNATDDPTATRAVSTYDKLSPFEIGHGTAVAGIIGAIANNGVGLRGVVPNATIAGSNWLEDQSMQDLDLLWYSATFADDILVSNNSWGAYMSKDTNYEEILKLASTELRGGKGRIFTFAAGNERKTYGNANLSYISNNRYAIAVASIDNDNKYSDYSNPGSNILVSAYGGREYDKGPSIATTLLTGKSYYRSELGLSHGAITFDDDTQRSYTFAMNGTSAATPMVSGALALVLTSCPDLSYRDIRWLLSYTSKKIDLNESNWIKNSAGRNHNINYGYGLIDANAMIKECQSRYYETLPTEKIYTTGKKLVNVHIEDNNTTKYFSISVEKELTIEWIELTVDSDHPYAGDYEIHLISPAGARTQIIAPNEARDDFYRGGFRFSSAAFIGEKSKGTWIVEVVDRLKEDSGNIISLEIKVYGHDKI